MITIKNCSICNKQVIGNFYHYIEKINGKVIVHNGHLECVEKLKGEIKTIPSDCVACDIQRPRLLNSIVRSKKEVIEVLVPDDIKCIKYSSNAQMIGATYPDRPTMHPFLLETYEDKYFRMCYILSDRAKGRHGRLRAKQTTHQEEVEDE